MKKNILFIFSFLFFAFISNAQTSHSLIGYDNYFSPDTLYIQAGDTVQFTSVGYHSATEVSYADWQANTTNAIGFDVGFGAPTSDMWFVVNTVGTHYYICRVHDAMGMKGVIIVSPSTGILEKQTPDVIKLVANIVDNKLTVFNKQIKTVSLIDYTGKKIFESNKLSQLDRQEFTIPEIAKGVYIVSAILTSGETISCKVVY